MFYIYAQFAISLPQKASRLNLAYTIVNYINPWATWTILW